MNVSKHGLELDLNVTDMELKSASNSPFIHALLSVSACTCTAYLPKQLSKSDDTYNHIESRLWLIHLQLSSSRMKHATSRHGREPCVVALSNHEVGEALASIIRWVKFDANPSHSLACLYHEHPGSPHSTAMHYIIADPHLLNLLRVLVRVRSLLVRSIDRQPPRPDLSNAASYC